MRDACLHLRPLLGGELLSWAPLAKALDVLGREYAYAKPVVFYVVHA